ncbi:MAG: MarC family protein [Candidatus Omnitrophica bacterium]|nr:MarC family protein [Candidatus Omnitrophota bacterium]MCB9719970.1 MarC family protein [Candidatus Omnitrophota bacterium]
MLHNILLAFIPIFVAVDALGCLPIFFSLTRELTPKQKRGIIVDSLATAASLALAFIVLGRLIFRFLGITEGDFMIAGGGILFCIAIIDLLQSGKERRQPSEDLGVVPLGTPLIVGPAVLTTCLIIVDQYGIIPAMAAVLLNILLAGLIFLFCDGLMKLLGQAGSRALSKVMALFLAAIAVMMVRKGITALLP